MPKKPMDYSKCVIYKIVCNDESVLECYVGHTTSFKDRKRQHKKNCKSNHLKLYQMIRENGGWDNFTMTPICEFPCENLIQACIKEEEYRVELQSQLNMRKAYQSEENRKEYKKEIDKKIRSSPTFIKKQYPEKEKEYRENHKEHYKELWNEWYEKNKEKVKEKAKERSKERIMCECGKEICKGSLSRHRKTHELV
jgi:hypothetical protein